MNGHKRLLTIIFVWIALAGLAACSSGGSKVAGGEEVKEVLPDLTFSTVKVDCERRDGLFGGRYVQVKVEGSVKNNTDDPMNASNLTELADEAGAVTIKAELGESKLLAGETADVTYEGELDLSHNEASKFAFEESGFTFQGLEDAIVEVNEGVASIVDEYETEDGDRKASEEEAEAKKAEAKKKIEDCVGKTAADALKVAQDIDYDATFKDAHGVDVTDDVENEKDETGARAAKVTDAKAANRLFLGDVVTFTLDYTDKEAEAKREEKAAAEKQAAAKKEEAKKQADSTKSALEACVSASAADVLGVAKSSGYSYKFLDAYGVDVTKDVENVDSTSGARGAIVASVDISSSLFGSDKVSFKLDYTDAAAAVQRAHDDAMKAVREKEKDPNVPADYRNALKTAQSYSDNMHMSRAAIHDQLVSEFEKFSEEATAYALDNMYADWNANALASAQSYSDNMHMSRVGIYDQLVSEYGEHFAPSEAQFAIDNVRADWGANALATAKSYQRNMAMSTDAIYDQLVSEYGEQFTPEEAAFAIANL